MLVLSVPPYHTNPSSSSLGLGSSFSLGSVSQYRTNTERERMKELGQSRNVEVRRLPHVSFLAADCHCSPPIATARH